MPDTLVISSTGRPTDRRFDRQTDKLTERQTDRLTERPGTHGRGSSCPLVPPHFRCPLLRCHPPQTHHLEVHKIIHCNTPTPDPSLCEHPNRALECNSQDSVKLYQWNEFRFLPHILLYSYIHVVLVLHPLQFSI